MTALLLELWQEKKKECFLSGIVLLSVFIMAGLVLNHNWLSYLLRMEKQNVTQEVLGILSRNQFVAVLYCAIYVILSIVFVGHIWQAKREYQWLYLMVHVAFGILGCIGEMGLPTEEDILLHLLANSYYALAAVPLFLYLALLMEKCKNIFVPLVLMYCICGASHLIIHVFAGNPVAEEVAKVMGSVVFYVTLLALIIMMVIECRIGNRKMRSLLHISGYLLIIFFLFADIWWMIGKYDNFGSLLYDFWRYVQLGDWESLRIFYIQWFLALVCMVYVAYDYCVECYKDWMTVRLMKVKMDSALEYANKSQQYVEEVRKIKHDMNRHLAVLQIYLSEGKQRKAMEYLECLGVELEEATSVFHCKNMLVNFLVEKYRRRAEQENILFISEVQLPEKIGVEDADICSFLDNVLENAMEACADLENGKADIRLSIYLEKSILRVFCSNTYGGTREGEGEHYVTTKENKSIHGYGLLIMEKICDKYGGALSVQTENNRFCVRAAIPEEES